MLARFNRNDLRVKRGWYVIAPPRERRGKKVCGLKNSAVIICAAGVLSANPLTCSLRRLDDSDFVVFCFVKVERRGGVCQAFRWEAVAGESAITLTARGHSKAVA
jgi:hypothetical protein